MSKEKWDKVELVLDKYHVKPIVAVIPNNEDPMLQVDKHDDLFWEKVKKWEAKGWEIALHGYNHVYVSNRGGLVSINKRSEFAGLPYEVQEEKIKRGIEIFRQHGIDPKIWVAPAHTFDKDTLKALKQHTNISIISDGIALKPYKRFGFTWIPVQLPFFKYYSFGLWTVCLHPGTMREKYFPRMIDFMEKNKGKRISVPDANNANDHLTFPDRLYSCYYWTNRMIMKLLSRVLLNVKSLQSCSCRN
jgi:peptidoglycan/xylan/chitin deacetylase (PgdA/CDA1 family)